MGLCHIALQATHPYLRKLFKARDRFYALKFVQDVYNFIRIIYIMDTVYVFANIHSVHGLQMLFRPLCVSQL